MPLSYIVGFLIFIAAFWLRIRVFRPHFLGNLLFFTASLFCGIIIFPDFESVLGFATVFGLIAHFCAKRYDKSSVVRKGVKVTASGKKTSTSEAQVKAQPEPPVREKPVQPKAQAQPKAAEQPAASAQPKASTQPKASAQPKASTQPKPAEQPKPVEQPKPADPPVPQVQQTLTTCVCCGQPLKGPKCRNCGFDHIAEPVYLLCLMHPGKLQIQIEPESEL